VPAAEQEAPVGEELGISIVPQLRATRGSGSAGEGGSTRRLGGKDRQDRQSEEGENDESDQIPDDSHGRNLGLTAEVDMTWLPELRAADSKYVTI
jgi:hypothetical protein